MTSNHHLQRKVHLTCHPKHKARNIKQKVATLGLLATREKNDKQTDNHPDVQADGEEFNSIYMTVV